MNTRIIAALAAATIVLAGGCTTVKAPDTPTPTLERQLEGSIDDNLNLLAAQLTWDQMTPAEQAELCLGMTLLGHDEIVALINEGADDWALSEALTSHIEGECL